MEPPGEEVVAQSDIDDVITSGGGFSAYYSRPNWQDEAVADYFQTVENEENTPVSGYNTEGRGYPDISLAGWTDTQIAFLFYYYFCVAFFNCY